jgi:hypothetical protein
MNLVDYTRSEGRELWLVGKNHSNYLINLLSNSHVKYFDSTYDVEPFVKNCKETAGILLGRTTIEGWLCGKPGWIYDVDGSGNIRGKILYQVPDDINKFDSKIDSILLLQPTSPIRILDELKNAIQMFSNESMESLVSVTEMREHPYECIKKNLSGWDFLEKPEKNVTRRQDYKHKYLFLDGSFYIASKEFLLKNKSFVLQGKTLLFESKLRYSIDIDELEDMDIAESILKRGNY